MKASSPLVALLLLIVDEARAFSIGTSNSKNGPKKVTIAGSTTATRLAEEAAVDTTTTTDAVSRRSLLGSGGIAAAAASLAAVWTHDPEPASAAFRLGDPNSAVGREIRSFNALVYEFRNTALDGGLDASALDEPSIPFVEFGDRMRTGAVSFVEFLAPEGRVAYATLQKPTKKGKDAGGGGGGGGGGNYPLGVPIRIGQGYPTGGRNSWSSPDYVIRSVSNFGVPYKFTVPALSKFKKK